MSEPRSPVPRRSRATPAGWSLRRRTRVTFGALAAVVLVLLATIGISLAAFVRAGNDVVYRWAQASVTGQALFTDLLNQETGVRGYALSSNPDLLVPYTDGIADQRRNTDRLRSTLRSHANLQAELDALDEAAQRWRARTAEPILALVRAGDPDAHVRIDSDADKENFDAVRARATTLIADIDGRTADAINARSRAAVTLSVAIALTAVLLVACGVAVLVGLHRWVLDPVEHLAAQTRDVADGDARRQIHASGPPELAALGADVETMRLRILDEIDRLQASAADLARSNADLEQFAYVASHDLSEPLRKVANFCQLLERQYAEQLDDRARQYIGFAVDGAKRMQVLINDLLSLSRVGRTTESFAPVDLNRVLDRARGVLRARIEESGARIEAGPLPTVPGDESLLASLLANLIGNAIKYRGAESPLVRIDAELEDGGAEPGTGTWTITVADNGIGIDPQYADRIFALFQRLHLRDEYGGTGIGLALCRRIVEFHGGQIWLDTQVRHGATFRFTLPTAAPASGD